MSAAGASAGVNTPAGPSAGKGGAAGAPAGRSYGSGARILSIGLALTGVVTLGFFVLASHALNNDTEYGRVSLLWAITFMITSVIYRPIEQLLARSIADARSRGGHAQLRTPILLQAGSAVTFVVVALLARGPLQHDLLGGEAALYWVLVGAVTTYSLSYFARGWLAGSGRPELYGALVFIESSARCLFPIVALLGITHGTLAVALGISAAPLLSLAVVPLALRGGVRAAGAPAVGATAAGAAADDTDLGALTSGEAEALGATNRAAAESLALETQTTSPSTGAAGLSLRAGAVFAGSTVVVMLAEQLLINVAVFIVALKGGGGSAAAALSGKVGAAGAAGAVFNAFLVSRAPLQLFQAIQSTLLPHLAALSTSGDKAAAAKALRTTMLVIAGFAVCVTIGLLAVGPVVMHHMFKSSWHYTRISLALVGIGMGLHLAAGTLNQSALAHGRAPIAAGAWASAAVLFLIWMFAQPFHDAVLRAAAGYAIAAGALLIGLLAVESRTLRGR